MGSVGGYPVKFSIDYPEKLSRGTLLLKTLLGWAYVMIPHGIVLWLYGIAVGFVQFIAWWVILFTGRYPRSISPWPPGFSVQQSRIFAGS